VKKSRVIASPVNSGLQADLPGALKKPSAGVQMGLTERWPMYSAIGCGSESRQRLEDRPKTLAIDSKSWERLVHLLARARER
jgi:hypothetical protein